MTEVTPVAPGRVWKVVMVGGYVGVSLMMIGISLTCPYMVLGIPLVMMAGMGAVQPLHIKAQALPECPNCGRYFEACGAPEPAAAQPRALAA